MWKYKVNNKEEAGKFVRMLIESHSQKEKVNVVIPGGRSIFPILNELNNLGKNTLEKVHFYLADERVDGKKNADMLYENYFNKALSGKTLTEEQIHFPEIDSDIENAIDDYKKKLPEKFDIIILGVGEDGHVASLFPGNEENYSDEKVIFIENSPKEPPKRVSLSFNAFNRDAIVVLLFLGEEKREALKLTFQEGNELEEKDCPASHFLDYEELNIITDQNFG